VIKYAILRIKHVDSLQADSFSPNNLRERSLLAGDAQPTDTSLTVESINWYQVGNFIYAEDPDNRVLFMDNSGHGAGTLGILAG
jgi:hypothetical protein